MMQDVQSPYASLDEDGLALVQQLVEQHGVVLDPQDPILLVQTMNARVIARAVRTMEEATAASVARIESSQRRLNELQRQTMLRDTANLSEQLRNELVSVADEVKQEVERDVSQLLEVHAAVVAEHIGGILEQRERRLWALMALGWIGVLSIAVVLATVLSS